jgi:lipid A 3-O-deacylase
MTTTTLLRTGAAALLATAASLAHAADFVPDAFSLQAGAGRHGAAMAGAGLVWDWDFARLRRHAELSAHTELMVNAWRGHAVGGGNDQYTQVVLLPSLRMQLNQGRSPWFLELGIGASWMDRLYTTPDKQFSTRWNFYDMLGVGRKFGADGRHELGLRWTHISNGGLKKPNPGEDFLQLRYVQRF